MTSTQITEREKRDRHASHCADMLDRAAELLRSYYNATKHHRDTRHFCCEAYTHADDCPINRFFNDIGALDS